MAIATFLVCMLHLSDYPLLDAVARRRWVCKIDAMATMLARVERAFMSGSTATPVIRARSTASP